MPNNITCPCVVKHNNEVYLAWKKLGGRLHLIDSAGKKFSGTPTADKCEKVEKEFEQRVFNGHKYFKTKIGIFSLSTGNKIKLPEILAMFDKPAETAHKCAVCGEGCVDSDNGYDTCEACAKKV